LNNITLCLADDIPNFILWIGMIGSKSIIYLPIRPSRRTIEEDELDF